MEPLFSVRCSAALARALGARPYVRVPRPDLSFPVFEGPRTHHAELDTEAGALKAKDRENEYRNTVKQLTTEINKIRQEHGLR